MYEEIEETQKQDVNTADEETVVIVPAEETSLIAIKSLSEESQDVIDKLVAETDSKKAEELVQMFNTIQKKKNLSRVNKLNDVQDMFTDQLRQRILLRPDEISTKEMLDGMKVIQDLMERGQKQATNPSEATFIQINAPETHNEVNIGATAGNLSRDSREKVKNAVLSLLNNIAVTPESGENIIEVETIETEDSENG